MTEAGGATPAPAQTLDFAYQWTPAQHARARHIIITTRLKNDIVGFLIGALVLVLVAGNAAAVKFALDDEPAGLAISLPVTVVVLLLLWFFLWGRGRLDAFRQQRSDTSLQHPIHHIFGVNGLRVRGKTAEVALRWKAMDWVTETPDFVLFYYSPWGAYYLPTRAVTPEQLTALRSMLRTYVGDIAELKD